MRGDREVWVSSEGKAGKPGIREAKSKVVSRMRNL